MYLYVGTPSEVADPVEPLTMTYDAASSGERAIDGTLYRHYTATKRMWTIKWDGLTLSQRDTIMAVLDNVSGISFQPPNEATTYSVTVSGAPEVSLYTSGRYAITVTLMEA